MANKLMEITEKEYKNMIEHLKRMRETIEVLLNKQTVKKLNCALKRIESGKFLTKKEMIF